MIDEEYARLLARARISLVQIGLQTTNAAVEPTIRQNNLKLIAQNAMHFRNYNLPTVIDLIVGCPGDDLRGLRETIRFVTAELRPVAFRAYLLTVIPGTPLALLAQRRGTAWLHFDVVTKIVERSESFTGDQLQEMDAYANVAIAVYNYVRDAGIMPDDRHELLELIEDIVNYCGTSQTAVARRIRLDHQRATKGRDVRTVMKRLGRSVPREILVERALYGGAED
jgi:hypothetical protein